MARFRQHKLSFWRDEKGALGGFPTDLLAGVFAAYGLYLIMAIFGVLLQAFGASVVAINFGHAFSMNQNGIDPATGNGYASEAVQAFQTILPVSNATSAVQSIPPTLGQATTPDQLLLYIGGDPDHSGFDLLSVDYALELPISIPTWNGATWVGVSPTPIQLYFNIDFYQEW